MKVQLNSMTAVSRFVCLTKVAAQALLAVAALSSTAAESQAVLVPTVIFSENFNATPDPGKFTFSGGGSQSVTGGKLEIVKPLSTFPLYVSTESFVDSQFTVETLIGGSGLPGHLPGNETWGLVIGNRAFGSFFGYNNGGGTSLFHEFDVADVHAGVSGYQVMPFIAAEDGTLHKLKIEVDAITKTFNVTFTDGNNPLNVYTKTFVDAGWTPGGVGLFSWFDGFGTSLGYLDNLQVTALRELVVPAPEPSSAILLGLGSLVLIARRRNRR